MRYPVMNLGQVLPAVTGGPPTESNPELANTPYGSYVDEACLAARKMDKARQAGDDDGVARWTQQFDDYMSRSGARRYEDAIWKALFKYCPDAYYALVLLWVHRRRPGLAPKYQPPAQPTGMVAPSYQPVATPSVTPQPVATEFTRGAPPPTGEMAVVPPETTRAEPEIAKACPPGQTLLPDGTCGTPTEGQCPPGQFWDGFRCRGSIAPGAAGLISAAGAFGGGGGTPFGLTGRGIPVSNIVRSR